MNAQPFPALVLPMHPSLAGYRVVAWARGAELVVADPYVHDRHEEFFFRARQFAHSHHDVYLLVRRGLDSEHEAMAWNQQQPPAPPMPTLVNPMARDQAELARRKAAAPLKPSKPQMPCDHGLFSDDADQLDLIEMFQQPVEDAD